MGFCTLGGMPSLASTSRFASSDHSQVGAPHGGATASGGQRRGARHGGAGQGESVTEETQTVLRPGCPTDDDEDDPPRARLTRRTAPPGKRRASLSWRVTLHPKLDLL